GGGRESAQELVAGFSGEQQPPAQPPVAVGGKGRRRRREAQRVPVAVALDERAASDVALYQAFGFELRIGIGHRGPVDAQNGREFPAGRDAVAGAQIACVHQGTKLVAQLDIERNVAFRLKVYRKHCLSPEANLSRYWPGTRAILSFLSVYPPGSPWQGLLARGAAARPPKRLSRPTLVAPPRAAVRARTRDLPSSALPAAAR